MRMSDDFHWSKYTATKISLTSQTSTTQPGTQRNHFTIYICPSLPSMKSYRTMTSSDVTCYSYTGRWSVSSQLGYKPRLWQGPASGWWVGSWWGNPSGHRILILLQLFLAFNLAAYFFCSHVRVLESIWEICGTSFFASSFDPAWVTALLFLLKKNHHSPAPIITVLQGEAPPSAPCGVIVSGGIHCSLFVSSTLFSQPFHCWAENLWWWEKLCFYKWNIWFLSAILCCDHEVSSPSVHGIQKNTQKISSSHLRGHQAAVRTMSVRFTPRACKSFNILPPGTGCCCPILLLKFPNHHCH